MVFHLPFPSLQAYFELARAFQRSLLPATGAFSTRTLQPAASLDPAFRFATGASQAPTLSVAVVDCINQVQTKLGHGVHPHFCQLLVTVEPYGRHVSLAPQYVQEIFGSYGLRPPTLIGGAVEGLLGVRTAGNSKSVLGSHLNGRPTLGVSLMAAVLPGVRLYPFHSDSTALPDLPWDELLEVGTTGSCSVHRAASMLLGEPHFTQVPELLRRLQSAMPGMPVLGGVVTHGAWGDEFRRARSLRGALFLDSKAHDSGAVGCIMTGPLQLDWLCAPGCRPVGPSFTVTRVLRDGQSCFVAELDGRPAYAALVTAQRDSLSARDRLLRLQLGIRGEGGGYVQYSPRPGPGGSIDLGLGDAHEGSAAQLHVQDQRWAQQEMRALLQRYAAQLPPEVRRSPSSLGALLYSCTAVAHDEAGSLAGALQADLPQLSFQGAKVQGEIGRVPVRGGACAQSMLQSYCSSFGFMRRVTSIAGGTEREQG